MASGLAAAPFLGYHRAKERVQNGRGIHVKQGQGGWHSGRFAHTFAAIDLGTNNCRLLVARASVDGYEVIDAYSRPVRLGEGVALNGTLCGDAIERTLACAERLRGQDRAQSASRRARHIATEACRRACNGEDFLAMVKERTGLCFEVIPPAEEARLALASCENLLDPEIPVRPADRHRRRLDRGELDPRRRAATDRLGGVETELLDMTSVPWGVVTLTESCVKGQPREQPVTRACYDDMVERIRADLRPFCAKHGIGRAIARGEVQMIGASGTVTTVSAHHLGLKRYNRTLVDGSRIGRDSILRICDQLSRACRWSSSPTCPASATTAPTSRWPAAPSSRRCAGSGRRRWCGSPTAACARAC